MKNLIQKYLVFQILTILIASAKAEAEDVEKMNIHKEFDFPPIFYTNIDKLKSHPSLVDSPLKPLMHLKKAMGTLPARLPPIYYPHQFFSHGPYEGDAKIMFQNHVQAIGMMMPHQHPNLTLPDLTQLVLSDETRFNDLQASHTFGLISKLQQQMTAQQALKQLGPQAAGMRPQQGVAGAAQGAAQGVAGAAQSAAAAAHGAAGATRGAAGAAQGAAGATRGAAGAAQSATGATRGAAGAAQGAAGATRGAAGARPGNTTAKPGPPAAPPIKPPDFDYTEENLWLTGGLYITALILKGLGSDIQFQAPLIGRRKREEVVWERERFSLGKLLTSFTARTKSVAKSRKGEAEVDQCLEFVACKQPFWAHFYLINLKQMKTGQLLQNVLQRLEKGISVEKNKCGKSFVCKSKNLPSHFLN